MSVKKYIKEKVEELTQKTKVNEQELHNLKLRTMLKEQKELDIYISNNELKHYINLLLQKYGKSEGEFNINLHTGEIFPAPKLEPEPAKEETK